MQTLCHRKCFVTNRGMAVGYNRRALLPNEEYVPRPGFLSTAFGKTPAHWLDRRVAKNNDGKEDWPDNRRGPRREPDLEVVSVTSRRHGNIPKFQGLTRRDQANPSHRAENLRSAATSTTIRDSCGTRRLFRSGVRERSRDGDSGDQSLRKLHKVKILQTQSRSLHQMIT